MRLHHGRDVIVDDHKIIEKRPSDFGGGFYVTSSKELALRWTKRVAFRNSSPVSYLSDMSLI